MSPSSDQADRLPAVSFITSPSHIVRVENTGKSQLLSNSVPVLVVASFSAIAVV